MRCLIQRVKQAQVSVEGEVCGKIAQGYLVLLGACDSDDEFIADKMVQKLLNLRIFEDEQGKMNKSITDIDGELLIVSQFTLYADCKKGNRPSFVGAGAPDHANKIYEYFCQQAALTCKRVERGVFGADMQVTYTNDGPVTILLDSFREF